MLKLIKKYYRIFFLIRKYISGKKYYDQRSFIYNERYSENLNFGNIKYFLKSNYFFNVTKNIFNKKNNKKILEVIIITFSKKNSFLKYVLDKKIFLKKIELNKLSLLILPVYNFKKIQIKNKDVVKKIFYIKKNKKKKLVLLIIVDGLSKSISDEFSNLNNYNGLEKFNNAWANSEWTLPSFSNLISGKYTSTHLCYRPNSYYFTEKEREKVICKKNIFEFFSEIGFVTGCYTGSHRVNPSYDHFKSVDIGRILHNKEAIEILDNVNTQINTFSNSSNFIIAHLVDGHHSLKGENTFNYSSHQKPSNLFFDIKKENENSDKIKSPFKIYDNYLEEDKKMRYRYTDYILKNFLENIHYNKYDQYSVMIFGDHGTKFSSKISAQQVLNTEVNNIGFYVKDNSIKKKINNNLIEIVDIFPSLLYKYNKNFKIGFDGSNSIFSKQKSDYAILESIYYPKYHLAIIFGEYKIYNIFDMNDSFHLSNHKIYFNFNNIFQKIEIPNYIKEKLIQKTLDHIKKTKFKYLK